MLAVGTFPRSEITMALRSTLVGLLLVAGLGTFAWVQRTSPDDVAIEPATPEPATTKPPATQTSTLPVLRYGAPPAVREPTETARKQLIALPNGEFVPTLNGVVDAPAMTWPVEVPFAPIIGTERDSRGQEWYVHANGARSTTSMVFHSGEGRMTPSTTLALPRAPNQIVER